MNKLQELAYDYNFMVLKSYEIESQARDYEGYLLEYQGVECYIDELNLYLEYVILRSNCEDVDRFENNCKTVKLTLKEFDRLVSVLEDIK